MRAGASLGLALWRAERHGERRLVMNRSSLWLSMVAMGLAVSASASTSVGISVNIGDAPPPPVIVVRQQPHVVLVPGSSVYVVEDDRYSCDAFHYGVYWYLYNVGWWYRAPAYRGPFQAIEGRYVPRAILTVPARHWKHHPHGAPPGLAKKRGGDVVVVERGRGRGRRYRD